MIPLAAVGQLTDRMATRPDDLGRAQRRLADASAVVRAYTGQDFTRAVTTQRLRLRGGSLRLPQRPVNAVTAVAGATTATALTYTWDGLDKLYLTWPTVWPTPAMPGTPEGLAELVDVTYDHGYDEIPDDIVAVVCNMAARALGTPPEDAGTGTESITNYSVTLGPVGAAGAVGLFNDERRVLDNYRRVAGVVWPR